MASYNTSDFKKGIKVQIDGEPYQMLECNFVKPGKGNALYKCRMRNLVKGTVLDRTYKGGDSLEAADVEEIDAQYLYRQGEMFVFMDNENFEQYELTTLQVGDAAKYCKEGMVCSMILFNNNPISVAAPNHVILKIEYCEPAIRGNTATNLTKPVRLETGAEVICPAFVGIGDLIKVDTRTDEYIERAKECSAPDAEPAPGDDRAVADSPRDDWAPTASWRNLRLRAELMRRARGFFDSRGFLEVETPVLSADVVVDRHLEPMSIALASDATADRRLWLQTSPEFCLKRLLAAGGEAIYQVAKVFRAGERGRLHNPEFTMLEWYRRGDGLREGMQLLSELADELLGFGSAELLSYGEAFERYVGLDPHAADVDTLCRRAALLPGGQSPALAEIDRDGWLDWLLTELVQPQLGASRPTILYDYPASQTALARVREGTRAGEPPVAERFELYVRGVELANGYHELLDPAVLRARNAESNRQRAADGKPRLPENSRLLAAMDHGLPASSGVALGFDRLAMIAAGADSLDEVLAFPIERA